MATGEGALSRGRMRAVRACVLRRRRPSPGGAALLLLAAEAVRSAA